MRRIPSPDKIATREDVYNIAMDFPPDQARQFLEDLGIDGARRVGINAEEFYILKARVGEARWQEQVRQDRELAMMAAVESARMAVEEVRRQHDEIMLKARTVAAEFQRAKEFLTAARTKLTAFNEEVA